MRDLAKKVSSPNQERFPAYLGLTCQQSGNLTMEEVVLYQKIFHLLNSNTDTGNEVDRRRCQIKVQFASGAKKKFLESLLQPKTQISNHLQAQKRLQF